MMIPLVTRTTEEMVRTVPQSLREAALALGYPRWRTSLQIVLRTALGGHRDRRARRRRARRRRDGAAALHGVRQPVLVDDRSTQPIAALPLQIFTYAISPYDEWHAQAWAGALVLIALVLVISVIARFVTRVAATGGPMTERASRSASPARDVARRRRAAGGAGACYDRVRSTRTSATTHAVRDVTLDVPDRTR